MKRLLTIIIVLAMCMALLPTAVFAAEVVTTPTVDFNSVSLGSNNRTGVTLNSTMSGADLRILAHEFKHEEIPAFSPEEKKVTMAVTYTVEVTDSETYIPEITYAPSKYSPKVEVFLSKGELDSTYLDAVCMLDSSARLGIFDAYSEVNIYPDSSKYTESCDGKNSESIETRTTKFPAVSLEAGTYSLTLVLNDANADMSLLEDMKLTNNGTETTYSYLTTLYLDKFTLSKPSGKSEELNYVVKTSAFKDTSVTSVSSSTTSGILSLVSWIEKTDAKYLLDEDKTDGYQLVDRVGSSTYFNTHRFEPNGLVVQFKSAQYGKDYAKYGIRLNVTAPGTYQLSVSNDHNATDTYPKVYATNGEMTSGLIAKVRLAKVKSGEEATATSEIAANTYTYMKNALATGEVNLGEWWYDSNKVGQTQICPTNVTLEQGEYFIIFEATNESIAKNPTVNGSSQQALLISGITLTPVAKEEPAESEEEIAMKEAIAEEVKETGLSTTTTVNVYTRDIDGDTSVESAVKYNPGVGEEFTAQAEDVIEDNYEFMYWEKGLGTERRVVSDTAEYTLKAVSGATHLTAVYRSKDSTTVPVIFFNGNGDELSKSTLAENTAIIAPTNPAVFGGAQFLGWKLAGCDAIYTSEQVNAMTASGNRMIFVAQFADDKEKKDITVTVNGGALSDKKYYGEAVTVTADPTSGDKTFAYWKKGDEIVSFDKEYTFNAFENCELTAVYAEYKPVTEALRKIIIKGNVAEFIGLGEALEKGVIFRDTDETSVTLGNATHKIAMTTTGNHLAFSNDLENYGVTNYIGYAILSDNTVIYDK